MLPSERATKIVKARQKKTHYGHPARTHRMTAGLWSIYMGVPFTEYDVAQLLSLHKFSREKCNPHKVPDNIDDQAGYANVYRMLEEADGSLGTST